MALARLTILISLLLYTIQEINGQQSGFMNGPTIGQNNLNQVFQTNPGTTAENYIKNQNGNSGNLATNFNVQGPVKFQTFTPKSTTSTQSTLSLQQPQSTSQPLNHQLSQIPDYKNSISVQPSLQFGSSFLQQPAGLQKSQNSPQQQNVYKIPLNIQSYKQLNSQQPSGSGDYNIQQQLLSIASPVVQQIPVQSSPGISIPNASYVSSFPSVSATPNFPYQRTEFLNNLGTNYLPSTASAYTVMEIPKTLTSYSAFPSKATPTSISQVTHSVMPYGNQAPDIIESPLRVSNNFFIEDEENNLNKDSLTSVLLSLLQSPRKSLKSAVASSYPGIAISKASSIKSLLPLIFNLLSEKREGCFCREGCQNCQQKKKIKKDTEPKIYSGNSRKTDYSLRDEMFQKDKAEEEIPRMVKEQRKIQKLKNSIPIDSCEDEDADYSDCSEEEED